MARLLVAVTLSFALPHRDGIPLVDLARGMNDDDKTIWLFGTLMASECSSKRRAARSLSP